MMTGVKRKKVGRPKGSGKPKEVLYIKIPPALKQALQSMADVNDRSLTAEAIVALKKHAADLPSAPLNGLN